jgi:hypothetical protein
MLSGFFSLWLRFCCQFLILCPHSIVSLIDIQIALHSGFYSFKLLGMIDDIDGLREELLQLLLCYLYSLYFLCL